jgi:hypothetical protein
MSAEPAFRPLCRPMVFPRGELHTVCIGWGSDERCSACGAPITSAEHRMNATIMAAAETHVVPMHLRCFSAWQNGGQTDQS